MNTISVASPARPTLHADFVARSGGSRRLLAALGLSLGVLSLELVGGLVTGSLALLSDATHVGVDVLALVVGFATARLAAREPNDAHTYGFHRFEAIGALANAVLLVTASSAVLVESVGRLVGPPPGPIDAPVVLAIASVGLVANATSAWFVHGVERSTSSTRVLVLHLGGDALGAIAVIVSALVIMAGGPSAADAVASLVIAVLLALAGLRLLGQIVHLLSEGVPTSVPVAAASAALHAIPGVRRVTTSTSGPSRKTCQSLPPTSRPGSAPTVVASCWPRPTRSTGSASTTPPCNSSRNHAARADRRRWRPRPLHPPPLSPKGSPGHDCHCCPHRRGRDPRRGARLPRPQMLGQHGRRAARARRDGGARRHPRRGEGAARDHRDR